MNEWNIQSRARACQACHKAFADKDTYYTLLFDQKRGLERFDVCEACWKSQYGQGASDRKGFVSFWQGLFAVPAPPPPDPILKETAESLLRRLLEQNDPHYAPACFILGARLERKRMLKATAQVSHDGQDFAAYEHVKTGEVFTIPDPHLHLDQLEEVQQQVAQLLQMGSNPPELPASPPATDGADAVPMSPSTPGEPAAMTSGSGVLSPGTPGGGAETAPGESSSTISTPA